MPGAARLADRCTGHNCFPSRPNVQASQNVFINGRGAHRQGDKYAVHCKRCGLRRCHDAILARGSPTVYTNGRQAGRIADPVSCGGCVMTGSTNVFIGP